MGDDGSLHFSIIFDRKVLFEPRLWSPFFIIYLKVFAVEVLKAVTFEEGDENLEHSLGVGGEAAVTVGAEALDKVRNDIVQTLVAGGWEGGHRWFSCFADTRTQTEQRDKHTSDIT